MKNTTSNIIKIIVLAVLGITAITSILISMFGNVDSNLPLQIGLGCTGFAGVITMVDMIIKSRNNKAEN